MMGGIRLLVLSIIPIYKTVEVQVMSLLIYLSKIMYAVQYDDRSGKMGS
jgi:hypothetical protein